MNQKWFDPNIFTKKPMLRVEFVYIVQFLVLLLLQQVLTFIGCIATKVMGIKRAFWNAKICVDSKVKYQQTLV